MTDIKKRKYNTYEQDNKDKDNKVKIKYLKNIFCIDFLIVFICLFKWISKAVTFTTKALLSVLLHQSSEFVSVFLRSHNIESVVYARSKI